MHIFFNCRTIIEDICVFCRERKLQIQSYDKSSIWNKWLWKMYINLALYAGMSLRGIGMPGPHSLGKDLSSSKQHTNSGREKERIRGILMHHIMISQQYFIKSMDDLTSPLVYTCTYVNKIIARWSTGLV